MFVQHSIMVDQFLSYLQYEKRYSPRTVQSYDGDLKEFEAYIKVLGNDLSWHSVDADVIRGWMESMMDKGNVATTINRRLSALRSFYRFALSRNLVSHNPAHAVVGPKKEKPLPQFVKETEMDELFDNNRWGDTFKDVRARTILLTFYSSGIRVSELRGLHVNDIDFASSELRVTGKRNKQRVIPFGQELAEQLMRYLTIREVTIECDTDALFITEKGQPMAMSQVQYEVKKYLGRVCTLKKRSPHVLRHTFATAMLNHGAGLESVKKLLGHESLSTTEIYTHTTFEQLKNVYTNAHPRANL